jgi:nucleoside-diphosphate-sugar epimerase
VQPGQKPIIKPLSFVGNTVHMMQHLLLHPDGQVDGQTYYLGDYPEHSIQEWADMIRNQIGRSGKTPVFPISVLYLMGILGDTLKKLGWPDPPITTFRLKNMLTGAHYPIEKTESLLGQLPYTMKEGINQTLEWMRKEKLIKSKN